MQAFNFKCPTEIVFGRNAEDQIADKIKAYGGTHVFIVYGGGSVLKSGLLAKVERLLTEGGLAFQVFGGVQPNPLLSTARSGVREALEFQANFILGIGGGSVIDTAKAIAHGVANPETDIWDFWTHNVELKQSTPIGAIVTIAAAGSEMSDSAVLTDQNQQKKLGLSTPLNRPTISFLNPELTYTVPPKQLACGISDIFLHTLERYFSSERRQNLMTDLIAESLMKTVILEGRHAMQDSHNYDTMSELLWSAGLSHCDLTGLGRPKDFSVHKLGHELSARYNIAHGESLTALWGSWARYVYQDDPARFAHYAEAVWNITEGTEVERALAGIRTTVNFFHELGMPTSIPELQIGELNDSLLNELAERCTNDDQKVIGTFHPLHKQDVIAIYRVANQE